MTARPIALLLLAVTLAACQQAVYLMPTPESLRTGEIDIFEQTPEWERNLTIPVIYATNRLPRDDLNKKGYSRKFDDTLRFGIARVQVGDDLSARWEDLYAISTREARRDEVPLRLQEVTQYFAFGPERDPEDPSPDMLELFAALDGFLAQSADPDLLIFIHGANNNFYRSVAQAAQYRHFTGRHSVVVAFVWPSMENILRYGRDVKNAKASAPMLADLLELVAMHTQARYINLLGYSLGAKVLSDGLFELRSRHQAEEPELLKQRLRIGEVYFAAADISLQRFVSQLSEYRDMVGRVSLTINMNDSALGFAQFAHGRSRAGRPDAGELSAEETRELIEASKSSRFDVVEIGTAVAPYEAFKAHDYWYNNPRVSNDIILQMLSHAPPPERGLERHETPRGFEVWYFPDDYQQRAIAAALAITEKEETQRGP